MGRLAIGQVARGTVAHTLVGTSVSNLISRETPLHSPLGAILVVGYPGCPPCEDAFDFLTAHGTIPVRFVRIGAATRDVSGFFPKPVATAASTLHSALRFDTVPVVIATNGQGMITYCQEGWPATTDGRATLLASAETTVSGGTK